MVESGTLMLDVDVDVYLKSWKLPDAAVGKVPPLQEKILAHERQLPPRSGRWEQTRADNAFMLELG